IRPSPAPQAASRMAKPMVTPAICGIVCAKPKFTPDAASMMLFGPGVNAITQANNSSARNRSRGIAFRKVPSASDRNSKHGREHPEYTVERHGRHCFGALGVARHEINRPHLIDQYRTRDAAGIDDVDLEEPRRNLARDRAHEKER